MAPSQYSNSMCIIDCLWSTQRIGDKVSKPKVAAARHRQFITRRPQVRRNEEKFRSLPVGQIDRPVAGGRVPPERADGITSADLGEGRVHQVPAMPLASEPSLEDGRDRRVPYGDVLPVCPPQIPLPRNPLARRASVRSRMAEESVQCHVLGMKVSGHREVVGP